MREKNKGEKKESWKRKTCSLDSSHRGAGERPYTLEHIRGRGKVITGNDMIVGRPNNPAPTEKGNRNEREPF